MLANGLEYNFSIGFKGIVWSTMMVPDTHLMIVETRQDDIREAHFSAIDFIANEIRWQDVSFDEKWWIGLTAATSQVLLLYFYHSTENPDDKGLMAYDIIQQKILWQCDHFSFVSADNEKVQGYFTHQEIKPVILNLLTGEIMDKNTSQPEVRENIMMMRPFPYTEGQPYFETVKSFLDLKLNVKAFAGAEYLEHNGLIFISYYTQEDSLANYLVVIAENGTVLWHGKIGEQLKGMGLETFFILSGCLFFVRNKHELVSFRIV